MTCTSCIELSVPVVCVCSGKAEEGGGGGGGTWTVVNTVTNIGLYTNDKCCHGNHHSYVD